MAKANDLYIDVPAGQYLFREGDAGAEMYIVESGSIAILRTARGSEPLAVLEPGDFLGEMSVLEDQPRFASALAQSNCRLLRIERAAFAELLRQNVEIAVRIMRKLALRQRRAEQRISELQQELQCLRAAPVVSAPAPAPAPAPAAAPAPAPAPAAPAAAPVVPAGVAGMSSPRAVPASEVSASAAIQSPTPPVAPAPVVALPRAAAPEAVSARPVGSMALVHAASGQRFPLESGRDEFLVGRIDPVTGITPEVNLGPLDTARSLSRRHAKLLRQGALLFLREEVGTANGTFINGQRLATGTATPVKPGDRLRFGTIDVELVAP
ncbi:cyclic nucleotide-binding domain-containing protein [Tahibacter sp.]|uniref:cyclic nucleotide-binding domain-containing protein n=1 Tax=Tahibacter sp. TaxID=2056211 RepID=UPI0028C3DE81|nr:cyclic nucleotide-binding domain-containing protein [Tahibacter sp.]